ncbi:fungal hydrophobin-domain-containing protein [Trametes meyenii]|nr:fungal hydrophobin-domain-containing protein [Trametes meyenii]
MFSRAIAVLYFALSLALLAAAMPGGSPHPTTTITEIPPASTGSLCSTGSLKCCQSVGKAQDPVFGTILGLLQVVVDGVDGLLGLQCSPIKIVGLGSDSACEANVVCCENNSVGGLISIGCIPIIL